MLSMIPSVWRGVAPGDIERIKAITAAAFPSVANLTPAELAALLAQGDRPILVDVRTPAEFAVSHLPEAHPAHTLAAIEALPAPVSEVYVLYCAVGFRSAALAEQLQKQGGRKVYNLAGSIFQWANEGRPLYRGKAQVDAVHPYSSKWAGLLEPRVKRAF